MTECYRSGSGARVATFRDLVSGGGGGGGGPPAHSHDDDDDEEDEPRREEYFAGGERRYISIHTSPWKDTQIDDTAEQWCCDHEP